MMSSGKADGADREFVFSSPFSRWRMKRYLPSQAAQAMVE
jgi:hypothetical protein